MSDTSLEQISILLLAPSRVLSTVLQHELSFLGYKQVLVVHSIETALKSLEQQPQQVLISSMYFEDGDILSLIDKLKQQNINMDILLVSSEQREDKIQRAMEAGVRAVLSRPFKAEELEKYLSEILHP